MEEWLDELARTMARGVSRREALGWLGQRMGGLALVGLVPGDWLSGVDALLGREQSRCPEGWTVRCSDGTCCKPTDRCEPRDRQPPRGPRQWKCVDTCHERGFGWSVCGGECCNILERRCCGGAGVTNAICCPPGYECDPINSTQRNPVCMPVGDVFGTETEEPPPEEPSTEEPIAEEPPEGAMPPEEEPEAGIPPEGEPEGDMPPDVPPEEDPSGEYPLPDFPPAAEVCPPEGNFTPGAGSAQGASFRSRARRPQAQITPVYPYCFTRTNCRASEDCCPMPPRFKTLWCNEIPPFNRVCAPTSFTPTGVTEYRLCCNGEWVRSTVRNCGACGRECGLGADSCLGGVCYCGPWPGGCLDGELCRNRRCCRPDGRCRCVPDDWVSPLHPEDPVADQTCPPGEVCGPDFWCVVPEPTLPPAPLPPAGP